MQLRPAAAALPADFAARGEGNPAVASCLDAKAQAATVLQLAAVSAAAAGGDVAEVVGAAVSDAFGDAVAAKGCAGGAVPDAGAAAQDCLEAACGGAGSHSACHTGHLLAGQPAMQRGPAAVAVQVASLAETQDERAQGQALTLQGRHGHSQKDCVAGVGILGAMTQGDLLNCDAVTVHLVTGCPVV